MPDDVKEEEDGGAAPSLEQFHDWVDQLQFTTVAGPERTAQLERVARTVCEVDELAAEATRLGLVQLFMNKLHYLNRALARGETGAEASLDLFASAVSACARAQDVGAYYKECGAYTPVPGAAVGAASTRPAALQHYRFPRSGVEVDVQEASWKDAKRAWRVWGGAHVLSQMLDERPELVAGRRVVELGAGVGLCGVLAHALGASHVLLTDREMGSLPALQASLERSPGDGTYAAATVDWVDDRAALDAHAAAAAGGGDDGEEVVVDGEHGDDDARARDFAAWVRSGDAAAAEPELRYEVVLASDVIYDMESATTLASAFARRLALTPHALGLVAQGVRYHSLQQLWLNLLVDTYGIEARIQAVTITEECYSINDMMTDDGGARDPADLIRWSDELTPYDPQQGLSEDYAGQFIAIWLRWAHLHS